MTHGEHGGCCGGASNTKKDGDCCNTGKSGGCCSGGSRSWITGLAVIVAVGAVAYAATKDGGMPSKPAKAKVDVASLIKGEDTVVAKMNGKPIKKSDVAAAIKEMGANVPAESIDAILPVFLEQYINLRLLNDAAAKAGLAKDADVQNQVATAQEQIMRAAYLRQLFEGKISEDAIKAGYKAKYEDQPMPEEVRARHILVDDEAKAKDIIAKLQGGANFEKLATEASKDPSAQRGGDLGYFVKTDMVKEFGEAAFSMPVGSVSKEPIKTQFGWHVVKVEDKRLRAKPSFEEAKQSLEQEARQAILDAKLTELREAAKIEVEDAAKKKDEAAPAAAAPSSEAPAAAPAVEPAPVPEPAPAQ